MRVFIWGMGLIGASLALALREQGHTIAGAVRSERSRDFLKSLGFTNITTAPEQALAWLDDADVLVLGLNIGDCYPVIDAVLEKPALAARLVLLDMCSTKAEICTYVAEKYPHARFVGTHPMAGKEKQGPEAAEPALFKGSTVFITPTAGADDSTELVESLWRQTGANTARIGAAEHDHMMAYVSHGLHVAACLIAELSGKVYDPALAVSPAAGSYRDMTRIAMSSGEMWQSIIASNRENVAAWLTEFGDRCSEVAAQVRAGNADMRTLFSRAERIRSDFMRK